MASDIYLHLTIEAPPVLTEDNRELAGRLPDTHDASASLTR